MYAVVAYAEMVSKKHVGAFAHIIGAQMSRMSAYIVMAYIAMAYVVMAYVVMAYVVMACRRISAATMA